ncbi:hypothetical protein GJ496_002510 [Pomphorhynchus laevis]|nr:hypothetical protein GJ496_002510 [Pomphorhynchus laevis]
MKQYFTHGNIMFCKTRSANNEIKDESDLPIKVGIRRKPYIESSRNDLEDSLISSSGCSSGVVFKLALTSDFMSKTTNGRIIIKCTLCSMNFMTNRSIQQHFHDKHINSLYIEPTAKSRRHPISIGCNICRFFHHRENTIQIDRIIIVCLDGILSTVANESSTPVTFIHMFKCDLCDGDDNSKIVLGHFNNFDDLKMHLKTIHDIPKNFSVNQNSDPETKEQSVETSDSNDDDLTSEESSTAPNVRRFGRRELASSRRYGPIQNNFYLFTADEQSFILNVNNRINQNISQFIDGTDRDMLKVQNTLGPILTKSLGTFTSLDSYVLCNSDLTTISNGRDLQDAADRYYNDMINGSVASQNHTYITPSYIGHIHCDPVRYLLQPLLSEADNSISMQSSSSRSSYSTSRNNYNGDPYLNSRKRSSRKRKPRH